MTLNEKHRLLKKALKEAEALEATLTKVEAEVGTLGSGSNNSLREVNEAVRRLKALAKLTGAKLAPVLHVFPIGEV